MTLIATDGTVIVAELDFVPSATEVAVSLTAKSFGGSLGAVYVTVVPLDEEAGKTIPHGALEQVTAQFTPARLESLVTFAENCAVPPIWTVADAGDTATLIAGGADFDSPPQPAITRPSATQTTQLSKNARRFMGHLPSHHPG
jgi:hypothetical protein